MKIIYILSLFVLCLCSCSTPVYMTVDAYSSPEAQCKKSYTLVVNERHTAEANLQNREFQHMTEQVLADRGFCKANDEEADVIVYLDYGISEPVISQCPYDSPVYGPTGLVVNSSRHYSSVSPQYGVVGYETKYESHITYERYLSLIGYDKNSSGGSKSELWRLYTVSIGEVGDLRRVFPALLVGSKKFIGFSTGQKIETKVYESNDEVKKLKQND